jgi:hypothetical protein
LFLETAKAVMPFRHDFVIFNERRGPNGRSPVAKRRGFPILVFLIVLLAASVLALPVVGVTGHDQKKRSAQSSSSGHSTPATGFDSAVGRQAPSQSTCGPPDYRCSYDGTDPKPLCADCALPPVPDMSARPNAVSYDKTFGMNAGNQIVRCTYPETNEGNNHVYVIGSGGSGDSHVIGKAGGLPLSYRLIVGDTHGTGYPFTYVPDAEHPKCFPTYLPMSSFRIGDGSFSWQTPHLYFSFGNFKVKALDLGNSKPPKPIPLVDFQQILPRDGPDWPGASQAVALGSIIRPRNNNAGKYIYQATCGGQHPDCAPGVTASTAPVFTQKVMTNTPDGTVRWRNIGVGFNGAPNWTTIGGLSEDDDVFAEGFSDAGGQGGVGAIFVTAYKRSTNTYYLFNVGTGVISYFNCIGGAGHACSGGAWKQTILGITSLPDRFLLHNVKINKNGEWVVIVLEECRFNTCYIIPGSLGPYLWKLSTTETKVNKVTAHPYGHWTEGFQIFANMDGDPGVRISGRTFAAPENVLPLNNTVYPPLVTQGMDAHPSWNYNDGSDTTPICTATAGFDWPYTIPWENEVVCYGTNPEPLCSTPGHGLCRNVVKRFFHTYNPATCDQNDGFWGCWGIGALTQDGKYYAFTSNWGDTLGSTSSGGHGPGSCRGGFNFQTNHQYQAGDVFEPSNGTNSHANSAFNVFQVTVSGKSDRYPRGPWPTGWRLKQKPWQGYYENGETILPRAHNPCNHAFQVTGGAGTPNGSHTPDWQKVYSYAGSCSSATTGSKVVDGGVTWTDIGEYVLGTMHLANFGRDDCRSDVFIGTLN